MTFISCLQVAVTPFPYFDWMNLDKKFCDEPLAVVVGIMGKISIFNNFGNNPNGMFEKLVFVFDPM